MNQFSLALRSQRTEVQSTDVRRCYLIAKINLETIPWNQYRLELQGETAKLAIQVYLMQQSKLTRYKASRLGNKQQNSHEHWQFDGQPLTVMLADGFFGDRPDGFPVLLSDTCYPTPGAPPAYFDPYHFLSHIVYLFSNNLHHLEEDEAFELMHTLANRIQRTLILKIFKSDSLSIRGLWQQLFNTAFKHEVADGLAFLMKIVLELHPDWIHDAKDKALYAAVLVNDVSLVQQLLAEGARPTYYKETEQRFRRSFHHTVFDVAVKHGNINCAKILLDNCDLNDNGVIAGSILHDYAPGDYFRDDFRDYFRDYFKEDGTSIFCLFLLNFKLYLDGADENQPGGSASCRRTYIDILALMLEAGADVDLIFPLASSYNCMLYDTMIISSELGPTCLDVCHQWDTSLSRLLLQHSRRAKVELTRVGVMMAAQEGDETLARYLNSVPTPSTINTAQYLELILAEQFSGYYLGRQVMIRPIHLVARVLIEHGISVRALPNDKNRPLKEVIETAAKYGLDGNLVFLLRHLIEEGASLDSDVLSRAVASQGTALLDILIRSGADVVKHSFVLLRAAAFNDNEDAIDLLLSLGVDVNAEGRAPVEEVSRSSLRTRSKMRKYAEQRPRHTILASLLTRPHANDIERWQLLIGKGAKLRLNASNTTCYELLRYLVKMDNIGSHWAALSFVLQIENETTGLSPFQWYDLLSMVMKRDSLFFTLSSGGYVTALTRRCDRPLPQPLLVVSILANCKLEFIQELIGSGADINEFSNDLTPLQAAALNLNVELVLLLLGLGADVNAPARGDKGATALQFVCGWAIRSTECMSRQSRLVRMLVAKGADVNAPANGVYGSTALQGICASSYYVAFHERDFTTRDMGSHIHNLLIFLLESGADVNAAPGLLKQTALQCCAEEGRVAESALLIQQGADPNGYPNIRHMFIEHQWVFNKFSSALDLAASEGRLDMTQYLLNVGALSGNPGATGFQGAIDIALDNSHHAVAEAIRRHVAKLAGHGEIKIDFLLARYNHALEERKAIFNAYLTSKKLEAEREEHSDEEESESNSDEEVDFDIEVYMNLP